MMLGTVLAVLAVLGLVGVAMAADGNATTRPARPLMGQVKSVDDANSIVIVKQAARRGGEAKEVTVVCDAKVEVTVDKVAGKLADLKADMYVTITPAEGKATKIVATKEAPARRGRGGAGAGGDAPK